MSRLSDETLILSYWDQFRKGDENSFNKLITIYYNQLYAYGCRFTRKPEIVKDCIQDVFLGLWKNKGTIGATTSAKFYLIASLRRKLQRESLKNRLLFLDDETDFENGFEVISPVDARIIRDEELRELSVKISAVLKRLSKRQQEIIYLRFYSDATMEEIAQVMDLNIQSVYNLLHDAIKRLKKISHTDPSLIGLMQILLPSLLSLALQAYN